MKVFATTNIEVKILTCVTKLEVLKKNCIVFNNSILNFSPKCILSALLNYIFPNAPNLAGEI